MIKSTARPQVAPRQAKSPPPARFDPAEQRRRLYVVATVTACLVVLLAGRLFFLQVVQHDHYVALAQDEHWQKQEVPARRGTLRDASGAPLAQTVLYESLYANTLQIKDPTALAQQLAPALGDPPLEIEAKLRTRQAAPVLVRADLTADIAQRVRDAHAEAVFLKPEPYRAHPEGNLATQIVGVIGDGDKGLSGMEAAYQDELAGKAGWIVAERDTVGDEITLADRQESPAVDGADITLTIDRFVQLVAERELAAAVLQHQAKSGSVVVLDPRTGAILAIASYPTIRFDDPALFDASRMPLYRIPAVNDVYEPGSVFKVVTVAGALDAGTITPETTFQETNEFAYASGIVRNAVNWPVGPSSITLALQRSSNVGAAWVGTTLGVARFFEYVAAFGFGQPTGSGLPGEEAGLIKRPGQPDWDQYDLAANSFGQGLAVTPLQMASAVATIANGGTLQRPYIVAEIAGPGGSRSYHPTVIRQVVRADTARRLSEMLVNVVDFVDGGKQRLSRVPGYRVAGKTGTAEIPRGKGYDKTATIASFGGYAPADAPRFVVLVKIDEPKDSPWGESVAAPAFRSIAQQLLVYYRVPPDESRAAEVSR